VKLAHTCLSPCLCSLRHTVTDITNTFDTSSVLLVAHFGLMLSFVKHSLDRDAQLLHNNKVTVYFLCDYVWLMSIFTANEFV